MKKRKILLVGGGTGGHVVPIWEIYKKLTTASNKYEVIVVGAGTGIERHFFSSAKKYYVVRSGKFRRHLTWRNLWELILFGFGLVWAAYLFFRERPSVVFSKGGYASMPIIILARIAKIPYFIHESDTEIGLTNRFAQSGARKIFVGFPPQYYRNIAQDRLIFSGPIVRESIGESRQVERETFGFGNKKPVILITGGSQGSLHINKNLVKILPEILPDYNIIHQTGESSFDWVKSYRATLPAPFHGSYFVADFLETEGGRDRMLEAIDLADLVIARAGANTISELAVMRKPMILIPWKHAAADHQLKNAQILTEAGAAIVIPDDDLSPRSLKEAIERSFADNQRELGEMSANAAKVFPSDGLEVVCKEIIKIVGEGK
ncbi:MAG: UDP-N-acetylglucosamine--N-acetylmuramyl-(pentapeptide) pyrophosphoryl-undecaprenol N-acetylglucosamine transferase [Patescibacteria group bacterium]